jgi:hypothetical protein
MVSNMKKTLAGLALAALPLMASAQMNEMKDQALADVTGQFLLTNIGPQIPVALFAVPGFTGPAFIGLPGPLGGPIPAFWNILAPFWGPNAAPTAVGLIGSQGPTLLDFEIDNFGPTVGPFSLLNIGLFNSIPGIGPHLLLGGEATFKASVLGGIGAAVGTTYILQNGLTLPLPSISFTPVRVI